MYVLCTQEKCCHSYLLLQVCSSLKIQCQMYLREEEAVAILGHILCTCPPFSAAGVRFIQVALCILLACPFLIR